MQNRHTSLLGPKLFSKGYQQSTLIVDKDNLKNDLPSAALFSLCV